MYTITKYTPLDGEAWDTFIDTSKNATFLLRRAYMDYHSSRFRDHSLLFRREGRLRAVLPANVVGRDLFSHGGLTYGGLIMDSRTTAADTLTLFAELNAWLRDEDIERVVYKPTPWIYHTLPSEEDLYALSAVCGARLTAREVSTAVAIGSAPPLRGIRRQGVRRAREAGVSIEQDAGRLEEFWDVLDENLMTRHGVHPVHTLSEMRLLMSRFPKDILLYTATHEGRVVGGTVLYDCGPVLHTQYISASPQGKRLGAIDAVISHILDTAAPHRYLDFGKSTENRGLTLNTGLIYQKEGFGGRAVCYDTYEWEMNNEK